MANYDFQDIKQAALGQWPEILIAFGIEYRAKEKNGPCPLCGGHDRAHMKNSGGKVMLYCRHCGNTWADELLLQLCFNNNFADMCKELGDYLHCQPSERREQVRTQAVVAEAANVDLKEAQQKIDQAVEFWQSLTRQQTHPVLIRYGIGADCFTSDKHDGAIFPMKIDGNVVDWLVIDDAGQSVLSGSLAKGSKLVIKPEGAFNKIFVTPDLVDAYYLFQIGREKNIVICCGSLSNLHHVVKSLQTKNRIVVAVENSLDALDALQTIPRDIGFIMPDEDDRKFCEMDYKYKPAKIYDGADSGEMYKAALTKAGI